MSYNDYTCLVKGKISKERYEHTLGVVESARALAEKTCADQDKAALAALLHDYAKDLSKTELLKFAQKYDLVTCRAEMVQPDLLHGPVGAALCREELGLMDEEILGAIRYHTTGRPEMSRLEIIVYLADLIEPGRTYEGVEELRRTCGTDLLQGLLQAFDFTLLYVLRRKFLIHPLTVEARNWLLLTRNNPLDCGGRL